MKNQPVNNQAEALEHASVKQYCKTVRVPTIAANFVSLAEQAVKENHSHIQYLEALLAIESEERDRHAIANRIRDAQLPRMKTLEEFDFAQAPQIPAAKIRELAEGGYLDRNEPVVFIGECGTGKSHLANQRPWPGIRQRPGSLVGGTGAGAGRWDQGDRLPVRPAVIDCRVDHYKTNLAAASYRVCRDCRRRAASQLASVYPQFSIKRIDPRLRFRLRQR